VSGPIQSIERAAAILRLLSGRSRRLGVVELAGQLGLPKGTVHGILRTLQAVGFVEQDSDSGKYQLGAALLHIGSSYLDANELRTRALNWADALATQSGESVRIGTLLSHRRSGISTRGILRPVARCGHASCHGRRLTGPVQGFGKMWEKSYILNAGDVVTPQDAIATWKAHFPEFWPKGNRFAGALAGIAGGVIGMVVHVSANGRAYVIAGSRPADLFVEVLLVSLAVVAAILIESASRRALVFAAAIASLKSSLSLHSTCSSACRAIGIRIRTSRSDRSSA